MIFLSACSVFSETNQERLVFNNGSQKNVVMVAVPKGYTNAMGTMDSISIKERFFTYPSGSLLYINVGLNQPSRNRERIEALAKPPEQLGDLVVYKGQDRNGYYWKELRTGQVKVGYLNVTPGEREKFERALASVQIRK